MKKILENWRLGDCICTEIQESVWDIDHHYVLKKYDDMEEGKRAILIMKKLLEQGIPVAPVMKTKEEQDYIVEEDSLYLMTRRLKGSKVNDLSDPALFKKVGQVIAKLHQALKEIEIEIEVVPSSLLEELNGWIQNVLAGNDWKLIKKEDFVDTVESLSRDYEKLPKQLIHRDVHFGNFLFDQGEFSGYIDFDLSQKNIRILDLSYFLIGLRSMEVSADMSEEQWKQAVRDTISGYEEVTRLTVEEKSVISCVMEAIELLFAAWFLTEKQDELAKNAADLYYYVRKN